MSKNFGHPTSGNGGKIGLKIFYMKRGQTDTQTDTQTDRLFDYYIESAQWADLMKNFNILKATANIVQFHSKFVENVHLA